MYTRTQTRIHTHTNTHTHTHAHTCTRTHAHTRIRTHTRTHTCTHTQTHTHTHLHQWPQCWREKDDKRHMFRLVASHTPPRSLFVMQNVVSGITKSPCNRVRVQHSQHTHHRKDKHYVFEGNQQEWLLRHTEVKTRPHVTIQHTLN